MELTVANSMRKRLFSFFKSSCICVSISGTSFSCDVLESVEYTEDLKLECVFKCAAFFLV